MHSIRVICCLLEGTFHFNFFFKISDKTLEIFAAHLGSVTGVLLSVKNMITLT